MAGPGAARACRATWPSSGPSGPASIAAGPQTSVAVSRQSLAICEAISLPSDASGPAGLGCGPAAQPVPGVDLADGVEPRELLADQRIGIPAEVGGQPDQRARPGGHHRGVRVARAAR